MKMVLSVLLCAMMFLTYAAAEGVPKNLSYEAREITMPAAGLMLYVPADLEQLEGDEESYDLGFRFDGSKDTFSMALYVHDGRDMSLASYAEFYAERNGFTSVEEAEINGYHVRKMVKADDAKTFAVLFASEGEEPALAVYSMVFTCDTDTDVALANEILSTLSVY